jgi:hypothetical protein
MNVLAEATSFPTDANEILKELQTTTGLERFIALLVPGLVAILVYDLRVPSERRNYGEMVLAIVVYSCLLDIVGFVAGGLLPGMSAVAFIVVFAVLIPAIIGWFAVDVREWLAQEGLALSPFPMAWDQLFRRLGSSKELYGLVITLSDGRKVGGIYEGNSFVSTYPADGDLLIGVPCVVDQKTGRFVNVIATSYGLYLKREDILAIEVRELRSAFIVQEPVETPPNEGAHG